MWDISWIKWHWGRFSPSISVSPANLHSINCSTITIIYHLGLVKQASNGRSTKCTQSHPTKDNNNNNNTTANKTYKLEFKKQRNFSSAKRVRATRHIKNLSHGFDLANNVPSKDAALLVA
jgi:hypothetical protein